MNIKSIVSLVSSILLSYLLTWIGPIGVALWYSEMNIAASMLVTGLLFACILGFFSGLKHRSIHTKDGFLIVVLTWLGISFLSSIPFFLSGFSNSYIDAWIEAVSAITTTGVEYLGSVDAWPNALIWYRHQLEWVGGAGIIIMTIALMTLNEGAILSVYQSEFGQGVRDVRVTPRLATTARYVCFVYGSLWLLCSLLFFLTGVPFFYAMIEAMTTVSTGGFSVQAIYPIYANPYSQVVAIVFMLLGAIGFHTHYSVFHKKSLAGYLQHKEVRLLLLFLCLGVVCCLITDYRIPLIDMFFAVTAFLTTTGFEADIHTSSSLLMTVFTIFGLIGACAGSTAGGIKLIRVSILWQEAKVFLYRLQHPNIVQNISLDGKVLSSLYVDSVRGYVALFLITFVVGLVVFVAVGLNMQDAFFSLCALITNVGASVHKISISSLTYSQKFVMSIIMLLGRIEIAAFMLVCMPRYWRS